MAATKRLIIYLIYSVFKEVTPGVEPGVYMSYSIPSREAIRGS